MSKLGPTPVNGWSFRRVLIANRGEIALRILRTVQALGLEAVVVYHAADAATPAVAAADQAIEIAGATPVAAYLDGAQIIAAARESGAGAIHPGYGFLSENARFARQVAEAGIVFVGPTADAIELIGIEPGTRLRIAGGIIAEVLESLGDEWVRVRLTEVPAGRGSVGAEELCHATDVIEVL